MQEIQDKKLLQRYLEKYGIPQFFDTPNLPFRLYCYEPGEMMNILRPTREYLRFVVEGSFDLYAVRADGTRHMVYHSEGFCFLGDLEFCGKHAGLRYQEVTRRIYAVELPLKPLLPQLRQDVRFLNYLLDVMSTKFARTSLDLGAFSDLREALLYFIRYQCPDQTITNVGETAFRLNYSLRQTQRVLRELTQQGILQRVGKGKYIFVEETNP